MVLMVYIKGLDKLVIQDQKELVVAEDYLDQMVHRDLLVPPGCLCNNLFILLDDYGFVKNTFSALPHNTTGIEYKPDVLSCFRSD